MESNSGQLELVYATPPFDVDREDVDMPMYFSKVNTFAAIGGEPVPRGAPSTALLSDGRVLIAGGANASI